MDELLYVRTLSEFFSLEILGIDVKALVEIVFLGVVTLLTAYKSVRLTGWLVGKSFRIVFPKYKPNEVEQEVIKALTDKYAVWDESRKCIVSGPVRAGVTTQNASAHTLWKTLWVSAGMPGASKMVVGYLSEKVRKQIADLVKQHQTIYLDSVRERERQDALIAIRATPGANGHIILVS